MTRGQLPQKAGLPGLNGGGAAAAVPPVKYADLPSSFTFQPLAFETLGPLSSSTTVFLTELGRRLLASTGEPRETAFLFQRLSIAVQRSNDVMTSDPRNL